MLSCLQDPALNKSRQLSGEGFVEEKSVPGFEEGACQLRQMWLAAIVSSYKWADIQRGLRPEASVRDRRALPLLDLCIAEVVEREYLTVST